MGRKKKVNKEPAKEESSLDKALAEIRKEFGTGSIMKLGESPMADVDVIATGSFSLDVSLGVGGFPRGRVVEIYGPESSGKTTLALSAIKQAQLAGGKAAFIDAEHAFDSSYAKVIGVDLDDLLVSQPDNGEQALEIAEKLVDSNSIDLIVIDSVAALTPKAEIEGNMGDSHMGLQARLMSQAMRKLTSKLNKSRTCIVFINQIRMKIGVMFGSPETTTGGQALKFYSSVRIDLRRVETIKKGDDPIGNKVRATVKKNKVAPPFKKAEFYIFFDEGISNEADILSLGLKHGVVKKAGAWISFNEENIGQGFENTKQYLKDNPEVSQEIKRQVKSLLGMA